MTESPPTLAGQQTWRGGGFCSFIGTDAHRLKYAKRNLASTEKVLSGAANGMCKYISALQSHQQIIRASLTRMRAAGFQPKHWMNAEETSAMLEAQLQHISSALTLATQLQAQLTYKAVEIVGPFDNEKDYVQPQVDELTNDAMETYVQQLEAMNKMGKDHPKGWWDEADPATWIPYGWMTHDTKKWCRYARMATEEGNGLAQYYGVPQAETSWDPNDPLTWVPFGWRIKDASLWQDWHKNQQSESDESPHSGLLTPDPEWNEIKEGGISKNTDPNKDVECDFSEAYAVGTINKEKDKGRFESAAAKVQLKPVSPFGHGNYAEYCERKKKLAPELMD